MRLPIAKRVALEIVRTRGPLKFAKVEAWSREWLDSHADVASIVAEFEAAWLITREGDLVSITAKGELLAAEQWGRRAPALDTASDVIVGFLEERCEFEANATARKRDLQIAAELWCQSRASLTPWEIGTVIASHLEARGVDERHGMANEWIGVSLRIAPQSVEDAQDEAPTPVAQPAAARSTRLAKGRLGYLVDDFVSAHLLFETDASTPREAVAAACVRFCRERVSRPVPSGGIRAWLSRFLADRGIDGNADPLPVRLQDTVAHDMHGEEA